MKITKREAKLVLTFLRKAERANYGRCPSCGDGHGHSGQCEYPGAYNALAKPMGMAWGQMRLFCRCGEIADVPTTALSHAENVAKMGWTGAQKPWGMRWRCPACSKLRAERTEKGQ